MDVLFGLSTAMYLPGPLLESLLATSAASPSGMPLVLSLSASVSNLPDGPSPPNSVTVGSSLAATRYEAESEGTIANVLVPRPEAVLSMLIVRVVVVLPTRNVTDPLPFPPSLTLLPCTE